MSTGRGRLVLLTTILACLGPAPSVLFAQSPAAGAVLFVSSSPLRATVLLDGIPLPGLTPLLLRTVTAGPHSLLFRKAGYVDARVDVLLAAGDKRPVAVTLSPSVLGVVVNEPGEVDVAGAREPEGTVIGLPPGSYSLGRSGSMVSIRPVYPGERILGALDVLLPVSLFVAGLSTVQDLVYGRGSAHLFSPLTLTGYAVTAGSIGLEIVLRVGRARWLRSFRHVAQGTAPAEAERDMLTRAELFLEQGRLDEALAAFLRHAESFPESASMPLSLYQIAKVYQIQGQLDLALAALRLLLQAYPVATLYDRAAKSLADVEVAQGSYAAALESLARMVEVDPLYSAEDIAAYRCDILAAWGNADSGKLADAASAYRSLIAAWPSSTRLGEYHFGLASTLWAGGRAADALAELALAREGAGEELLERIGELEGEIGGAK